jgi:quercetin dioxygenase-like cupin family protein
MPPDSVLDELRQKLPGMLEVLEPDSPGMHTSDTIDFVHIVSGEIWLELDDGAQRQLRAGDCVIQNGTRHAWRNASTEPCVMAVALIGARRDQRRPLSNNPGAAESELSTARTSAVR